MTKMQIIAKSVLTVLAVYAVIVLYHYYPLHFGSATGRASFGRDLASFCVFTAFAAVAVYFLAFNNDELARKIAGPGHREDRHTQAAFLAKSLRVGLVFAGLMLLPNSIRAILDAPSSLGAGLDNIFIFNRMPQMENLLVRPQFKSIYGLFKAALAVYLILGAPHFVRRQCKRLLRQTSGIEPANDVEPSERTGDE